MTLALATWSAFSVTLLIFVWVPTAASATPGVNFRPVAPWPMASATCSIYLPVVGLGVGVRQLLWRPRFYGLVTMAGCVVSWVLFHLIN